MIFLVDDNRPISYQTSNSCQKKKYRRILQKNFDESRNIYDNTKIPIEGRLYANLIYIYPKDTTDLDVDNFVKSIIDAFNGYIYDDDKTIDHVRCTKMSLKSFYVYDFNLAKLPTPIAEKLDRLLTTKRKDILIFEVGKFNEKMVEVGVSLDEA